MKLKDKVAIVTGGAQGIGQGCSTHLAAAGAAVVIADIDAEKARQTVAEIEQTGGSATYVVTNVSDSAQVKHLMAETIRIFGRIDILINNAALVHHPGSSVHFLELTEAAWQQALDINLTGMFLCSQQAARRMVRQVVAGEAEGGCIINMSSGGASRAHRYLFNYDTTKGGVEAATRNMALALAPWNIRVNAIVPGNVTVDNSLGGAVGPEAAKLTIPLGHPGRPADIGPAAVFLASDEAGYMTGTRLFVDGGMEAQLRSPGVDHQPDLEHLNSLARRGFQAPGGETE